MSDPDYATPAAAVQEAARQEAVPAADIVEHDSWAGARADDVDPEPIALDFTLAPLARVGHRIFSERLGEVLDTRLRDALGAETLNPVFQGLNFGMVMWRRACDPDFGPRFLLSVTAIFLPGSFPCLHAEIGRDLLKWTQIVRNDLTAMQSVGSTARGLEPWLGYAPAF